ncbi:MAG TPA: tRNA (adenosine(37)-N6)-threonylcarbamoyltransferase complex ATPase subunit type 1 TsaE, partial [Clostridia bacterium]|nr:tRNA (adenosine(37)-N6)-threonylcarbamoyltransferase complex ATPase subunit type 1 TsaE [Clostridia bacterium]
MLELQTESAAETQELGEKLGLLLRPGDVVRLEGDLGAGKTTMAQGICRGLSVDEPVTSPTFAIMHHYNGKYPVYHIDAYRIESELELEELGLEEFL